MDSKCAASGPGSRWIVITNPIAAKTLAVARTTSPRLTSLATCDASSQGVDTLNPGIPPMKSPLFFRKTQVRFARLAASVAADFYSARPSSSKRMSAPPVRPLRRSMKRASKRTNPLADLRRVSLRNEKLKTLRYPYHGPALGSRQMHHNTSSGNMLLNNYPHSNSHVDFSPRGWKGGALALPLGFLHSSALSPGSSEEIAKDLQTQRRRGTEKNGKRP